MNKDNVFSLLKNSFLSNKVLFILSILLTSAFMGSLGTYFNLALNQDNNNLYMLNKDDKPDNLVIRLSNSEIENDLSNELYQNTGLIFNEVIDLNNEQSILIENNFLDDTLINKYTKYRINEVFEINDNNKESLNASKLLAGTYPELENEILLTDFHYYIFSQIGYKYKNINEDVTLKASEITSPDVLLNKKIGEGTNVYIIKGFVDTPFEYENLKGLDFGEYGSEVTNLIDYDKIYAGYLSENGVKRLSSRIFWNPTRDQYILDNTSTMFDNIASYSKLNEVVRVNNVEENFALINFYDYLETLDNKDKLNETITFKIPAQFNFDNVEKEITSNAYTFLKDIAQIGKNFVSEKYYKDYFNSNLIPEKEIKEYYEGNIVPSEIPDEDKLAIFKLYVDDMLDSFYQDSRIINEVIKITNDYITYLNNENEYFKKIISENNKLTIRDLNLTLGGFCLYDVNLMVSNDVFNKLRGPFFYVYSFFVSKYVDDKSTLIKLGDYLYQQDNKDGVMFKVNANYSKYSDTRLSITNDMQDILIYMLVFFVASIFSSAILIKYILLSEENSLKESNLNPFKTQSIHLSILLFIELIVAAIIYTIIILIKGIVFNPWIILIFLAIGAVVLSIELVAIKIYYFNKKIDKVNN